MWRNSAMLLVGVLIGPRTFENNCQCQEKVKLHRCAWLLWQELSPRYKLQVHKLERVPTCAQQHMYKGVHDGMSRKSKNVQTG